MQNKSYRQAQLYGLVFIFQCDNWVLKLKGFIYYCFRNESVDLWILLGLARQHIPHPLSFMFVLNACLKLVR